MKKVLFYSLFMSLPFVSVAQKIGCANWYVEGEVSGRDTVFDRSLEQRFLDVIICNEYKDIYENYANWTAYSLDGKYEFDGYVSEPGFYLVKAFFNLKSSYKGKDYVGFETSIIYDYRFYPKGSFYVKNSEYPNAVVGNSVYFLGNHYLSNSFTKKPDFKYVYYTKQSDKDSTIISFGDPLPVGNYDLYVLLHDDNDCYVDKVFSQKVNITGNMPPTTPPSASMTVCLNSSTDYFIDNPVEGSKYVWNISPSGMGEVVSNSESYDKISVKWKNVGDAEISVYEVNSLGCNSDASSIEVKVLESPSAQFDNASLCYGEPLNVILRGVAPFTLDYTLDGEAFSVPDISTNIYRMPETPGKYSILKVSDKNCTSVPENNNNAVIGKEMKKLKIKIRE